MGFLVKIHSTWSFLPTNDHIRGFSVLQAHFTGVREKLDIWAKSSLLASTPKELSLPKPLPQTALIHWPPPRTAQSPNLLFKFPATSEFQSSKYTRKSSLCWAPIFPESHAILSPRVLDVFLVFFPSEFIGITWALSHEWVFVYLNGRQEIKEWCGLRSSSVLHPWAPRHSGYLDDPLPWTAADTQCKREQ